MLTIERIAHPRQRRRATTTAAAAAAAAAPEEAASHILRPLTENLGEAWWSAHAHRCVEQLPQELAWAAPLLDPERPRAVRCAREQARRLIVWHHQLPTYEQVSFSCERPAQGARPGGRR